MTFMKDNITTKLRKDINQRNKKIDELRKALDNQAETIQQLRNRPPRAMTDAEMRAWTYNELTQEIAGLTIQYQNCQLQLDSIKDQLEVKALCLKQVRRQFDQ